MIPALAAAASLAAAGGGDPAEPLMLTCGGPVPADATAESLARTFGRANVRSARLDGAEGETERGTVLFPDDPARRIEIWWKDVKRQRRPASVSIRAASRWRVQSASREPHRFGLKSSMEAVEDANERPFTMNGFGWDYGGYADFQGGKLAHMDGGCTLSVRFNPDPKAAAKALDAVSGEQRVPTTRRALVLTRPFVSRITLDFGD